MPTMRVFLLPALAGAIAIAAGLAAHFLAVDACLDRGGMVTYSHRECADAAGHVVPLAPSPRFAAAMAVLIVVGSAGGRAAWRRRRATSASRPTA